MINEYDRVIIKATQIKGTVVDIRNISGDPRFIVETDVECDLVDCVEKELVKIDGS